MNKTWPFGSLQMFGFDLMVIDPAWRFALYDEETGGEKSAQAHYDCMDLDEIRALPIGQLARGDCLCLMWGCGWMRPSEREATLSAFGFTYKSEMVWRKTTRNGKVRMGPGYRVRTMHETIYVGTIGNPQHKPFPSIFDGVAREHSRKPEEFYALIDRCCPKLTFRADLFSRTDRPGWQCWGNEVGKFGVAA